MSGGVQFVVGSVLEREQGAVGTRYGQEELVELALVVGCTFVLALPARPAG
jgi:hypothetical protein